MVHGHLQTGSYVDKSGITVYTTDVIADNIEIIDWKQKAEPAPAAAAPEADFVETDEEVIW